jgi:hypothetical protein
VTTSSVRLAVPPAYSTRRVRHYRARKALSAREELQVPPPWAFDPFLVRPSCAAIAGFSEWFFVASASPKVKGRVDKFAWRTVGTVASLNHKVPPHAPGVHRSVHPLEARTVRASARPVRVRREPIRVRHGAERPDD